MMSYQVSFSIGIRSDTPLQSAPAILEGWTTLTYYTGLYPHLHFGQTVLSQSFRNPALLAKIAATLQYVS